MQPNLCSLAFQRRVIFLCFIRQYVSAGKRMLPAIPHAELLLFCAVSGGLMHLYENEPDTLAGFLRSTIRRFVHRPNAPLPHSASEAMMQVVHEDEEEEDEEERSEVYGGEVENEGSERARNGTEASAGRGEVE